MEYYNSVVNMAHEHVGQHISNMLSLSKESGILLTQVLLFFTLTVIILQLISFLSSSLGSRQTY